MYKVSVPGSLMLFGEHAVLRGKQSVVAAVDHYIHITLIPEFDDQIQIFSSNFAAHTLQLDKFKITKPYDYLLAAIKQYLPKIKSGFKLEIHADFPANIGFGSSAAVTVAVLGVLHLWLHSKPIAPLKLYRQALDVVHSIQGLGSGADVAASVFGGVIAYKQSPTLIKKIADSLPLAVVYSGSKMATAKVVTEVAKREKQFKHIYTDLYVLMENCTKEAVSAIKRRTWLRLGELMNIHQGLQDALGVNNAILAELIFALCDCKGVYGAKISGSGLGDCVVGLGKVNDGYFPQDNNQKRVGVRQIQVAVSKVGIVYRKT